MSEVPDYRKLIVWQKAHKNAIEIIDITEKIRFKYERIMVQCVTSATSIGANIAEGNAAGSESRKRSYFEIALNSGYEFDNWLQVLKDSRIIGSDKAGLLEIEKRNIEVIKILTTLVYRLSS